MRNNSTTFFRIFRSKPHGHGGEKRAFQLEYILKEISSSIQTEFLPFDYGKHYSLKVKISALVRTFSFNGLLFGFKNFSWYVNKVTKHRIALIWCSGRVKRLKKHNVIWESSFPEFYSLPYFFKKME